MSVRQFVFLVLSFYILGHPACYNSKLTSDTIDLFGNVVEDLEWVICPTQGQYKGRQNVDIQFNAPSWSRTQEPTH